MLVGSERAGNIFLDRTASLYRHKCIYTRRERERERERERDRCIEIQTQTLFLAQVKPLNNLTQP